MGIKNMEISYYNQNNLWNRELTKQEKERIEIINKLIPKDVKTILDAGCGSGTLTNFFDSKKYDITGIDISDTALEYFKHKKVKGSISNLPFEDNSFDLVICSDVLEHIPEKEFDQSIKELKRVSKKYILIISPNDEDIEANQIKCWNCKTIFHINWHIRSLNLEKLVDLFREEFSPVFYTYFGDIWASEPKIKYKIKRIFNEGFLHWEYAICPLCGSKQDKKERNHLSFNIDKFVDKNFNKYLRNFHLNKTEIAVLFTKIENKINQFKYISDTSSHLITLSKKENIDFYTASRFYINLGDNVFCRDKTLPYTSYSYILKSEQSLWSDIKEDNDGKFRSLSSNSRALAIFPITDLKNKRLYISLKVLQNNCNLKVNIYDIEKSFINISTLNLNNINTKETVSIDLPIEIYFPSEGIIIEFVAEPLNEKICEVNFYEMCVSDINLLSPSKKNLTTHKSIEILNMNLNLFKVNKSLLSDDIVVFSESDIYIYNNRLKCFKILEERLFFNENNNMKINELENKLESLLNKLDENNNMKINELENKLENLINKLDENNNMKINELENKLESLLNKLNKINSNIQRISNNIERTIFWAKNPHKFLYRKISSKMSNYLKLKNKTSDSEEKLQDDKFHVVVLTPDVQI
ncbi:methyltransferase domain-containing protein, partial [Persephonella sp.]